MTDPLPPPSCPCCGRPIDWTPEPVNEMLRDQEKIPLFLRVPVELSKVHHWMTSPMLADLIYGHHVSGGPDYSNTAIRSTIHNIRRRHPKIAAILDSHSRRGYKIRRP